MAKMKKEYECLLKTFKIKAEGIKNGHGEFCFLYSSIYAACWDGLCGLVSFGRYFDRGLSSPRVDAVPCRYVFILFGTFLKTFFCKVIIEQLGSYTGRIK